MEPTRLFDFIYYQKENFPQEKAFGYKKDGQWKYFSTQEAIDYGMKVSQGLLKLGVKPGDKVAIIVYKKPTRMVFHRFGYSANRCY